MDHCANQRILVLGLGISGSAMARWCAERGASVTVTDTRSAPPGLDRLLQEFPQIAFVEPSQVAGMGKFDRICKSPGLTPGQAEAFARSFGVVPGSFVGELDLFREALDQLAVHRAYQPKVLGITGTNGKTTVTAMTRHLLEGAGKSAVAAGNISPSLLDALAGCLARQNLPDVWVLELSSFQLADASPMPFDAATVLNLTQDHLDWHADMEGYAAAKARIFVSAKTMVANRDDPAVLRLADGVVAAQSKQKNKAGKRQRSFGVDLPTESGDFGLEEVNGLSWLVRAHDADGGRRRREPEEVFNQRLMPAQALQIHGRHNALNALAALALASSVTDSMAKLLRALQTYAGEPHRVQHIAQLDEVDYFDDSKGTNVGATVAALEGLGASRKVVLILGGDGKSQDFSPLAVPVGRYARAVVLIGRDAPKIEVSLQDTLVPLSHAGSMQEAVERAAHVARAGDAVLLSPACASFDMFENYAHRAAVFCAAVQALPTRGGLPVEGSA